MHDEHCYMYCYVHFGDQQLNEQIVMASFLPW